jgi:hypothetical protein
MRLSVRLGRVCIAFAVSLALSIIPVTADEPQAPTKERQQLAGEPGITDRVPARLAGHSPLATSHSSESVPRLIKFTGTLSDAGGNPRSGVIGVTFALYDQQTGGAPLWLETQNVEADAQGRYTVLLGATKAAGIPVELFSSGEARWLAIEASDPQGRLEAGDTPRVLLVSVPYAMKASDAETLGGRPASDYVLRENLAAAVADGVRESQEVTVRADGTVDAQVGGSGTTGFLAKFVTATSVGDSVLFESSGNLGIGTLTPLAKLHVVGGIMGATGSFSGNTTNNILAVAQTGAGGALVASTLTGTMAIHGLAEGINGTGVFGEASSTSGPTAGVRGLASSPNGTAGVFHNNAASGTRKILSGLAGTGPGTEVFSVFGSGDKIVGALQSGSSSTEPTSIETLPPSAIRGEATSTTGFTAGIIGIAHSADGNAVVGVNTSAGSGGNGVVGINFSTGGDAAVSAEALATSGSSRAFRGKIYSPGGTTLWIASESSSGTLLRGLTGLDGSETEVFRVDAAGNVRAAGYFDLQGNPIGGGSGDVTSSGANIFTAQNTFTATPTGAAVNQGPVFINPASASAGQTLFGVALGGVERLRLDSLGNLTAQGTVSGIVGFFSGLGGGVLGRDSNSTGSGVGVTGISDGPTGAGVFGQATSTTGANVGVRGTSAGNNGAGVLGQSTSTAVGLPKAGVRGTAASADGFGVRGENSAAGGTAIFAQALGATGTTRGLYGTTLSTGNDSTGVTGESLAASGTTYGVRGFSGSTGAFSAGVAGRYTNTGANFGLGVFGITDSTAFRAAGVRGDASTTTTGGAGVVGVQGVSNAPDSIGVHGLNQTATGSSLSIGVLGEVTSPAGSGIGVRSNVFSGAATAGVFHNAATSGTRKILSGLVGSGSGTEVFSVDGSGNVVASGSVTASSFSGNFANTSGTVTALSGVFSGVGGGVVGSDTNTSGATIGVQGLSSSSSGFGVVGTSPNVGVQGQSTSASGTGGVFTNTVAGGKILRGIGTGSAERFSVFSDGKFRLLPGTTDFFGALESSPLDLVSDAGGFFPTFRIVTNPGNENDASLRIRFGEDSFVPVNISSVSRTSNIATVNTSTSHSFQVGQTVHVAGVADSTFNGFQTIVSVPGGNSFTYNNFGANTTSSGGTVTQATDLLELTQDGRLRLQSIVLNNDFDLTASPRLYMTGFLAGNLDTAYTAASFVIDKPIQLSRITIELKTGASGCSVLPIVRVTNGVGTNIDIPITSVITSFGTTSFATFLAGQVVNIRVQQAASGCSTFPANGNVVVHYRTM